MPSTVLYQAQMPVTYKGGKTDGIEQRTTSKTTEAIDADTVGWLPYIVSGPLAGGNLWGVPGAILHVIAWLVVVVIDTWTVGWGELDRNVASGRMYPLAIINLVAMIMTWVSFAFLFLVCCINFCEPYLPGTIAPWILTIIKGGINYSKIASGITTLILGMGTQTIFLTTSKLGSDATVPNHVGDSNMTMIAGLDEEGWRFYNSLLNLTVVALLFKVFVSEFLGANIFYAGTPMKKYA